MVVFVLDVYRPTVGLFLSRHLSTTYRIAAGDCFDERHHAKLLILREYTARPSLQREKRHLTLNL